METRTVRMAVVPGQRKQPVPTITYTFRVLASWKGAEEDSIRILVFRGNCEPRYLPNADLLVYAFERRGMILGDGCSSGIPINAALFDRYVLGRPGYLAPGYQIAPVAMEDLFLALNADDEAARKSAAKALARIEEELPIILPRLTELLRSGTTREQESAVRALGLMKDGAARTAIPAIERLIDWPVPDLRVAVHETLYRQTGQDGYYRYAVHAIRDPDENVCLYGVTMIQGCHLSRDQRSLVADALAAAIASSGPAVREEAITALRSCGCEAVKMLPTLDHLAHHDTAAPVRSEASVVAAAIRRKCGAD